MSAAIVDEIKNVTEIDKEKTTTYSVKADNYPDPVDTSVGTHVHGPNCKHVKKPSSRDLEKDAKNLKASKYDSIKGRFAKSFLIKNKKTGAMAEIRAASSVHACTLIGWRPKNVSLVEVMEVENEQKT